MRTVRLILCIPAGFLASVILGAAASWITDAFGGASWYIWMVSGAASAFAFFWIAFHVAPARTSGLKWTVVAIVGLFGLMAALGPLLAQREPARAFAGVAMMFMAITYARMSVAQVEGDIAKTIR